MSAAGSQPSGPDRTRGWRICRSLTKCWRSDFPCTIPHFPYSYPVCSCLLLSGDIDRSCTFSFSIYRCTTTLTVRLGLADLSFHRASSKTTIPTTTGIAMPIRIVHTWRTMQGTMRGRWTTGKTERISTTVDKAIMHRL